jgi:maltose alpha-D-glucosyltransferase/alpha-amylase
MPRLYMSLKQRNKGPIIKILERTPAIPPGTQWLTFLRNHDELTLEMVTADERQWMWEQYAPDPRMRLNLGIRRRLAPLLDNDRARWLTMNALLLSLPGTPIVYYGDEIGMGDNIWLPDRYGVRTPMQWSGERNAGFSKAEATFLPVIDNDEYGYRKVNVAAQEGDSDSYLEATRYLLKTRKQCPELQRGQMEFMATAADPVLAYWRILGEQRTLCLYNLSAQPHSLSLELAEHSGRTMVDLLRHSPERKLSQWPVVVNLQPYASHWFRLVEAEPGS